MLLQILKFIQHEQVTSNQQIAREFSIDEQALQPMLTWWENKGFIRACENKPGCKASCFGCSMNNLVFYQYIKF